MGSKILTYVLFLLLIAQPVFAATYTIGSDPGDDYASWDALRDAIQPTTSDDITFRKGESHVMHSTRKQLIINWGGTSGDRVVIGAHGTGADPIIDFEDTYPALPDGIPCTGSTCYAGGITVIGESYDYVTFEDLDIRNVEGFGVRVEYADYFIMTGCNIQNTFGGAYTVAHSDYPEVSYSTFSNIARASLEAEDARHRGGGLLYTYGTNNGSIHHCTLVDGLREGIGFYEGSYDNVAYQNRITDTLRGIKIERSYDNTVRHNLIELTNEVVFGGSATGIISDEESPTGPYTGQMGNNLIYGNIILGPFGYGINYFLNNPAATGENVRFINNTIVGPAYSLNLNNIQDTNGDWLSMAGSAFKNNISWPTVGHVRTNDTVAAYLDIDFGPNQWASQGPTANIPLFAYHASDVIGAPVFNTPGSFQNMARDYAEIQMVAFQAGSPGVAAGTSQTGEFTQLFLPTDTSPLTATLSTVSTWDMGAVDYTTGTPPATETSCNNRLDDDGDENVDCADSDCSGEDYCEDPETTCNDNFDNDGNGFFDCLNGLEDPNCLCAPASSDSGLPKFTGGRWN